jgi:sulfate adenylyltransferase
MIISLREDQYQELEKLGTGVFNPVMNFMDESTFISVCEKMRLPSGELFPLPILLDVDQEIAKNVENSSLIELWYSGIKVGEIFVESVFTCNKVKISELVYGTSDTNHAGVKHFFEMGDWFIGGKTVFLKEVPNEYSNFEMTPANTRKHFKESGWKTIVGFQTRNVPHRAHEYLQKVALEQVDGLFIQPLIGKKKAGDYTPEAILTGYYALIKDFYPENKVLLGVLTTSMRYAGPKEALFHAIVRRNYGCTHFIIGRDHAGVGNYYRKYEAHELVKQFTEEELGIKIMFLHGPYYCSKCGGIVTEHTCPHFETDKNSIIEISGTLVRQILKGGENPDVRFFRPEILEAIKDCKLFIDTI